tara:strand:+ start:179 stop:544 length:366 start_codon:yes stop_codon:yes gene_type:complete
MRDLSNEINKFSQEKLRTYDMIMDCESPNDFKRLAVKLGANMRDKNHICITHKNGDVTSISCTPGKKISLFKTQNEFVDIYCLEKSNYKNEKRREIKNNRNNDLNNKNSKNSKNSKKNKKK